MFSSFEESAGLMSGRLCATTPKLAHGLVLRPQTDPGFAATGKEARAYRRARSMVVWNGKTA
ncbi:MAG: hypothetical protein Ct9H300mP28_37300 [Pseudomonadota bacterium]|nr:MAG: hypothetical protein Ct9H300mP28_37300 [Pseudomonadota bacterium]